MFDEKYYDDMTNYVDTYSDTGVTAYGFYGPHNDQELFDFCYAPFYPTMDGIEVFEIFLLILTFVNAQVSNSI